MHCLSFFLLNCYLNLPPTGPRVRRPRCAGERRWTFVLSPWCNRDGAESQTGLSWFFVGTDPDCLRPTKWNMLKVYYKNSLKVTLRITVNRLSLLLCFIEDFFFLAPFAAHSFTGELRVHHDLWRHQEDIPWAYFGRVWERKRWRNTADWSVEETGKLIIPCIHHLSWLRICSTLLLVVS